MQRGKGKRKSDIDKRKDRSYELYFSWKSVFCPAFKKNVHFTRLGWDHLMEVKFRTDVERKSRLEILPLAKKLIAISSTVQGKRFQDGYQTYELIALMDGPKIKVVISEVRGELYFFSVFKM